MMWIRNILSEIFSLFVDDGAFALAILIWLGIVRWAHLAPLLGSHRNHPLRRTCPHPPRECYPLRPAQTECQKMKLESHEIRPLMISNRACRIE